MTSVPGDPASGAQAAFAASLVDEWVRCGVTDAVVCPGSRSTPLAVALVDHPEMAVHVRLDERSGGFTALGIGIATGRPAVVLTTSGTAAAELHAAVIEADLACVPLVACTADRPPELRGIGAPQTIDQTHLFGGAVRWFADPGLADPGTSPTWRSLAARSVAESTGGARGPGPVHLNLPFREPLLGDVDAGGGITPGRSGGGPWHRIDRCRPAPSDELVDGLIDAARRGVRGVVVAGSGCGDPSAVVAMATALGWPVLADPRSGARLAAPGVVGAVDGIVRSRSFGDRHRPELILRLGAPWVSKAVNGFLAAAADDGADVIAVDPWDRWIDPERAVASFARAHPTVLCQTVMDRLGPDPIGGTSWIRSWVAAESAAQEAITGAVGRTLTEPLLARHLYEVLPSDARLMVSSSMPIRDLEAFGVPRPDPPMVLANRGANGIDGVVSTALGVALSSVGPTVALVGDLAMLHDVSSLVRSAGEDIACTVVVADNGGGGIFSFLEPASTLPVGSFETLFGTPQAPDVASVARGFGVVVDDIGPDEDVRTFETALSRRTGESTLSVIRVLLPDRARNVVIHSDINDAVVRAVDTLS